MIEAYKWLIQPIAIERDDETGRVTRELPGQVVTVFTADDAARAVTEFEAAIQQLQEGASDASNGDGRVADHLRQPNMSR